MAETREVDIARLAAKGDGVATVDGVPVHVAGALPGEHVRVRISDGRGSVEAILRASPDRVTPPCPHYGTCGGCVAQHLSQRAYLEWKHALVREPLAQRGIDAEVLPVQCVPERSRRRAVLSARRTKRGVVLGYHGARSHDVVQIEDCLVLREPIVAAFEGLREIAGVLASRKSELRLTVTETTAGLDIAVEGASRRDDLARVSRLAAISARYGFVRISVDDEPVIVRGEPVVEIGRVALALPPGAFLQATRESEALLAEAVSRAVSGRSGLRSVVDLFCGVGTFTLPLAGISRVLAVDGSESAIVALTAAVRRTQGLKPVEGMVRDLFRNPLAASQLSEFDAAILDPPRSGADAQLREISKSRVPFVVSVSCNPATFARDARTLLDAGFTMGPVQPVDQFLYSAHVEVVASFTRG